MYEELITELREEAEWAKANEWETPIMLSDHLTQSADAIEELQKKVPQWISVEERLPPVYKNVLSCDKYGLVKENYMISDNSWSVGCHITHWMPLPEPPKEENK